MAETVTMVARLSPSLTFDATSARRHWRCTSIAAGPTSAKLEAEGVIQRQGDGFPLDQSRVAYLRYLRRERQQSPRATADAEHAAAMAATAGLRIEEKQRKLVRRADVDALIDDIAGVTLTALSSLPARCAPRGDLAVRRGIERVRVRGAHRDRHHLPADGR